MSATAYMQLPGFSSRDPEGYERVCGEVRDSGPPREFLCGEAILETHDGRYLCPVHDSADVDALEQCDSCGLLHERAEMTGEPDNRHCKECR